MKEIRQTAETTKGKHAVMLYDSVWQGKMSPQYFDPEHWLAQAGTHVLAKGRGTTYRVQSEHASQAWVLRQYYRGGMLGRVIRQRYWYAGENEVRSFAEWRLLKQLYELKLPVPKPVAAIYYPAGLTYRAAILSEFVPDTQTLSQLLNSSRPIAWRPIARAIRVLHEAGLIHSDLNAHNILIDGNDAVTVIDLDKSHFHPGLDLSSLHRTNLDRLQHSIQKVSTRSPERMYADWAEFIQAYRAHSTR